MNILILFYWRRYYPHQKGYPEHYIKQQEKGSLLPLRLPRHDTTAGCRIWTKNKRKLKQRIAAELPTVLLMQISTGNLYRKCTLLLCRYQSKKKNLKADFHQPRPETCISHATAFNAVPLESWCLLNGTYFNFNTFYINKETWNFFYSLISIHCTLHCASQFGKKLCFFCQKLSLWPHYYCCLPFTMCQNY